MVKTGEVSGRRRATEVTPHGQARRGGLIVRSRPRKFAIPLDGPRGQCGQKCGTSRAGVETRCTLNGVMIRAERRIHAVSRGDCLAQQQQQPRDQRGEKAVSVPHLEFRAWRHNPNNEIAASHSQPPKGDRTCFLIFAAARGLRRAFPRYY